MNIDFEKIIKNISNLISSYIQIFVNILISPAITFPTLLGLQSHEKHKIIKEKRIDEKPFIFAGISLILVLVIGSTLSIKDAPTGDVIYLKRNGHTQLLIFKLRLYLCQHKIVYPLFMTITIG